VLGSDRSVILHDPHPGGKLHHQHNIDHMRFTPLFALSSALILGIAACDSPTQSRCDTLPTRVVSTSGDTAQTVTGLRYIDTAVGTGTEVRSCTAVEVAYVGRLENGTVFDSGTLAGALAVVPGGRQGWIAGFEQALIGMREGGARRAIIPPHLGYGSTQVGSIPPNSTLIFDLEIQTVTE
jgi:peptidylprolyl isomerase